MPKARCSFSVEQFHDAVELFLVLEVDDHAAFALQVAFHLDFGVEGLRQRFDLFLEVLGDEVGLPTLLVAGFLGVFGKGFGLPDVQFIVDDLLQYLELLLLAFDVDQCACMSHGDMSVADGDLHFGGQFEQAQEVGDGAAALADLVAKLFLGQVALVDETLVGDGHLYGIEVFAMDVFDERQFKHLLVVGDADKHRNGLHAGELGGSQTAFSGDKLIFVEDTKLEKISNLKDNLKEGGRYVKIK